jgi:hypothetical protein
MSATVAGTRASEYSLPAHNGQLTSLANATPPHVAIPAGIALHSGDGLVYGGSSCCPHLLHAGKAEVLSRGARSVFKQFM